MTEHALRIGDRITITRVPTRVVMDRERFPETFDLFEKALGRIYEIRGFSDYGHLEIWLHEDGSEDRSGGADSIWVEPEFVSTVKSYSPEM